MQHIEWIALARDWAGARATTPTRRSGDAQQRRRMQSTIVACVADAHIATSKQINNLGVPTQRSENACRRRGKRALTSIDHRATMSRLVPYQCC